LVSAVVAVAAPVVVFAYLPTVNIDRCTLPGSGTADFHAVAVDVAAVMLLLLHHQSLVVFGRDPAAFVFSTPVVCYHPISAESITRKH
jgi:hypothetical protein